MAWRGRHGLTADRWTALYAALFAALAWEAWQKLYSYQDDAFIYLRYAHAWRAHHELAFNATERVEGFTGPLWLALLCALDRVGVSLLIAPALLGFVATALLLHDLVEEARAGGIGLAGALAPTAVALHMSTAMWSASGMETSLFAMLWTRAMLAWRAHRREETAPGVGLGGCLAALLWTRPEGAIAAGVLVVAALANARGQDRWRAARAVGLPVLLAGVALLAARRWYFGAWVPNTYLAKTGGTLAHARVGAAYVLSFVRASPLVWAVPLVALRRASSPGAGAIVAAALLMVAHVVRVGGDFMPYSRFLWPLLASLCVVGGDGVALCIERLGARPRLSQGLAAAVLLGVVALPWDYAQMRRQQGFPWVLACARLGAHLRARTPAGASLLVANIGAVGYFSERPVFDLLALTDRGLARRPSRMRGGVRSSADIGHDHFDAAWSLARRPSVVLFSRAHSPIPFEDASEVTCALPAETDLLAAVRADPSYRFVDLAVAPREHWAAFVRAAR